MATVSDKVQVLISAKDLGATAVLRRISLRLRRMAVAAQQVGVAFTALGGIMAAGLFAVVKETVKVDDSLRKIAAKAELAFDGEVMKGIIEKVKELGRETPYTTAEVAELFAMLAQKNWSPEMMNSMAESVLKFASASGVELPEAADALASVMEMFGDPMDKSIEKMTHFSNVLAKAQTGSQLDLEGIVESLKQIGGFADYAGQTLEGMVAQLMLVSRLKLEGSRAGRTGRSAYMKMFSEDSRKELDRWGVSLRKNGMGIKKISTIIRELKKSMEDNFIFGEEDQLVQFEKIFGKVGQQFITALGKSADEADGLEKQLMSLVGTVGRMYAVMEGGIGGTFRNLKSAFMSMILQIGEGMKNYLGAAANGLIERLQEIEAWFAANPDFGLKALTIAAGTLASGLGMLGVAMTAITAATLVSSITAIIGALASLGIWMVPVTILLSSLMRGMYNAAGGANTLSDAWEWLQKTSERISTALSDMMMLFANGDHEAGMRRMSLEFTRALGEMSLALIPLEKQLRESALGKLLGWGGAFAGGGTNLLDTGAYALDNFRDKVDQASLQGRYYGMAPDLWNAKHGGERHGEFHGEKWMNEMAKRNKTFQDEMDQKYGSLDKSTAEMPSSMKEFLEGIVNSGKEADAEIKKQTELVKDYQKAWEAVNRAKANPHVDQKKMEDAQFAKMQKKYADLDRASFDKRMRAKEDKAKAWLKKWQGMYAEVAGYDWSSWWNMQTDTENPYNTFGWQDEAEAAKKTIESITYGKLGDFDSNTAAGKMNAKLNSMAEKQLKELERQTGLLGEIVGKMDDGGGIQIA